MLRMEIRKLQVLHSPNFVSCLGGRGPSFSSALKRASDDPPLSLPHPNFTLLTDGSASLKT